MKKKLLTVVGVGVVLFVGLAVPFALAFSGLAPVQPTTALPNGVVGVADGYVQAFIIPLGDGGAALVDCGQDPAAKALRAKLDELKLQVKAVFLTHGHGDHVGGCAAFPGAAVYALEAERALAEGSAPAKGPVTKFSKNDPAKVAKLSRGLTDGEVLELGAAKVKVFALPGHTAGSAAYLANGVLFLGDAATGQADGKVRNAPWVFSDDVDACAASLRGLAKRLQESADPVDALAFAHSGPLSGRGPLDAF